MPGPAALIPLAGKALLIGGKALITGVPKALAFGGKVVAAATAGKAIVDGGTEVIKDPKAAVDKVRKGAEQIGSAVHGKLTTVAAVPWLTSGNEELDKKINELSEHEREEMFKDLNIVQRNTPGARYITYIAHNEFKENVNFGSVAGNVFSLETWKEAASNAWNSMKEGWEKGDNILSKIFEAGKGLVTGFFSGFGDKAQNNVEDSIVKSVKNIEKKLIAVGAPESFVKADVIPQILDQAKKMAKEKSLGAIKLDFGDNLAKAQNEKSDIATLSEQVVLDSAIQIQEKATAPKAPLETPKATPPGQELEVARSH